MLNFCKGSNKFCKSLKENAELAVREMLSEVGLKTKVCIKQLLCGSFHQVKTKVLNFVCLQILLIKFDYVLSKCCVCYWYMLIKQSNCNCTLCQERTGKSVLQAVEHMDDGTLINLTVSIDERKVQFILCGSFSFFDFFAVFCLIFAKDGTRTECKTH